MPQRWSNMAPLCNNSMRGSRIKSRRGCTACVGRIGMINGENRGRPRCRYRSACGPISEVAVRFIEVRLVGRGRLDLLMLSSSHFDPKRTLKRLFIWR